MVRTSSSLSFDSSGSWWAVTAAAYCQGRMVVHPKSESTVGFYHPDSSPCISPIHLQVAVTVSDGEAIRVIVGPPMLSDSDPQQMSTAERLDFITW